MNGVMNGVKIAPSKIKSVSDPQVAAVFNDAASKRYHPSPLAWEDQLLYFLLPDRFSNNQETGYRDNGDKQVNSGQTPLFRSGRDLDSVMPDSKRKTAWLDAGRGFCGGTLKGVASKLGYLKRLGVSAIWIGPIFKQVAKEETYHGYAVQNFMDVDPRFGTVEDLKALVVAAHELEIYVLLDIILNHAGDVFLYKDWKKGPQYSGKEHDVLGYFDRDRRPSISFDLIDESVYPDAFPDAAVWPSELQHPEAFIRKGRIRDEHWDDLPEAVEGDFFELKALNLGAHSLDKFKPTPALKTFCEIYKYWIAVTDIDGFRIDTVKHMGNGPTKYFASAMHEYAESLGKRNFLLLGEISGPKALETVEVTGIDAALGIGEFQEQLWKLPKGQSSPAAYFNLFRNALEPGKRSYLWFRDKIITMIDDHDQIWRGPFAAKGRFCADEKGEKLIVAALALNLCTLGIPCIYYGSEQAFDGAGASDEHGHWADQYIREAMFGGGFGPFRSADRHCFDEGSPTYTEVARIARLRAQEVCLRRGRQYLREVSSDGERFSLPKGKPTGKVKWKGAAAPTVVAWSRLFVDEEILCAINTDPDRAVSAFVTVAHEMHVAGAWMQCLYPGGVEPVMVLQKRGRVMARVEIPPGGFVMYKGAANRDLTRRPRTS